MPGLITEHLAHVENDAVRRGQGYSVRVTAPVSVHVAKTEHSASALTQSPAGRKAHRIHADRVETARAS
ncbi:hypothetical protein [Streptomyces sp. NPDC094049]|uniref:hypothetical protein n=1 Tax=Streptomyces sp. NPDC094049 TaxID=3154987 RepID=UPI003323CF1C